MFRSLINLFRAPAPVLTIYELDEVMRVLLDNKPIYQARKSYLAPWARGSRAKLFYVIEDIHWTHPALGTLNDKYTEVGEPHARLFKSDRTDVVTSVRRGYRDSYSINEDDLTGDVLLTMQDAWSVFSKLKMQSIATIIDGFKVYLNSKNYNFDNKLIVWINEKDVLRDNAISTEDFEAKLIGDTK